MIPLNNIKRLIVIIILFICSIFTGCKDENNIVYPEDKEKMEITFVISGIENEDRESIQQNSKNRGSLLQRPSNLLSTSTVHISDQIDAIVTFKEYDILLTEDNNKLDTLPIEESKVKLNKNSASSPLAEGVTYIVVLYDANDDYVATINASSGISPVFTEAYRNRLYKWFAYSFNSTNPITLNSTSNPTAPSTSGSGLLYASGEFMTSSTQPTNRLNITFQRKTAAIEVIVDGRGLFDKLTTLTITNTANAHLKSGTFDLKTGMYITNTINNYNPTISDSEFTNFRISTLDTIRSAYLHTVDTDNAIENFGLRFGTIYQLTDLPGVYNGEDRRRTFSNVEFTFPNLSAFTPKIGKKYQIVITLVFRYLTVNNVDWAWTNLYFDSNKSLYAFRHHNTNAYRTSILDEFWNWRSEKPGINASTDILDPCGQVFPKGRWRMPTSIEFNSIREVPLGISTYGRSNAKSEDPVRYIDIGLSEASFAPYFYITDLPLLQLGYRNAGSDNIINYVTTDSGTAGVYFWTSDASTGGDAKYFSIINDSSTGTVMTVSNIDATMGRNVGMNIRCVRDNTYVYSTDL